MTPAITAFILAALAAVLPAPPLAAQNAAPSVTSGSYACNGTAYTMQITSLFGSSGAATLYEQNNIVSNATIRISGDNIAFTFITGGAKYQGKTWIYKITGAAAFEGNGEQWLRTADFRYPFPSPTSPAPGSITQPAPAPSAALQSGSYTLSGTRQRIALSLNGQHGGGALYDDQGRSAGEFRAAVTGQSLSITYISGPKSGITYDYHIQSETSFSRPGEMWARRY
jgi:hypothetical protein